ncbi:MAG: M48 family metalloprotease, partial [Candidatus Eremiobacterota bacterium]
FIAGHEQGHVELRHQAARLAYLEEAGWRLAVPFVSGPYQGELDQLGQEQEKEADCYALGLIRSKGYGMDTAGSALAKVTRGNEEQGRDHPSLQARLDNLRACLGPGSGPPP